MENTNLIPVARKLRKQQTPEETKLWQELRSRRFIGNKFRRQFPIGHYVVDFICFNKNLVIELDGSQHNQNPKDIIRDTYIKGQGFKVLRFWNNDINQNFSSVLEKIYIALQE